jgi:hypothetical protein
MEPELKKNQAASVARAGVGLAMTMLSMHKEEEERLAGCILF